jgi:hypothetical protein
MTVAIEEWQERNAEYLGAALAQLRLRLSAAAQPTPTMAMPMSQGSREATTEPAPPPVERKPWDFFRRASPALGSAPPELQLLPPAEPSAAASASEAIAARLRAASEGDPPPALLMLANRLGLSDFERDILLLCTAMEFDTGTASLCAAAQRGAERDHPTFALAMALFDEPAWEALSPERPLRYWRLIEIGHAGTGALTTSPLRADERIVNFVKGLNYIDDRIAPLVKPMATPRIDALPHSQGDAAALLMHALGESRMGEAPSHAVLALRGRDRESKRLVAGAAAGEMGLMLYSLSADALPATAGELETLARLWHRESLLLPLALYVDAHDMDRASAALDSPLQRLGRFVSRTGGVVFVDSRDGLALPTEAVVSLDIAKPTPGEQLAAWRRAIGDKAPELPPLLAAQFDLNQSDIDAISHTARTQAAETLGEPVALKDRLWSACLDRTRPQLARLADKLDAKATWEQIVLPATETAMLRQIAAQVQSRAKVYDDWGFRARMNRGLGVSALFAGDSGTGKTMAAEVLANELRLDLYRIDLSAVVSKYIGETEKNLRQVFDAAENGGAILLFDEADALFGKRSEVKDSHDRYANIEIDYLLQRMEGFSGLAILATNMKSALDIAFMRRLRFIVNFPYPGAAERRRMWERVFPADTPVGVLDHERLARLSLTGGNIHSIALNAAFMAAQAGTPVTMNLLLEAGRMEFRKLDRPVNEADFRWVEAARAVAASTTGANA